MARSISAWLHDSVGFALEHAVTQKALDDNLPEEQQASARAAHGSDGSSWWITVRTTLSDAEQPN